MIYDYNKAVDIINYNCTAKKQKQEKKVLSTQLIILQFNHQLIWKCVHEYQHQDFPKQNIEKSKSWIVYSVCLFVYIEPKEINGNTSQHKRNVLT